MNLDKITQGIEIDRAINEFRSGRPIIVNIRYKNWIFFSIEHVNTKLLVQLAKKSLSKILAFITNKKASILKNKLLKHKDAMVFCIKITDIKWLQLIHKRKLSNSDKKKLNKYPFLKSEKFIKDIINLTKNAKMIPCLIGCELKPNLANHAIMMFDYNELKNQHRLITKSTKIISQSYIPIAKDHKAQISIFKSYVGGSEHIVLQIGKPNKKKAVNLRIQSVCLTGEVFHSMKCDCNEQLHHSIDYISKNGGGYIIHLEQEGRGIGLANKIKAYDLQNKGMDTFDADFTMGFLGEERDFDIAVHIIKYLKVKKVNLITNNQDKIKALRNNNIIIEKQLSTYPSLNKFNTKYLLTRSKRMNYNIKLK